MTWKRLLSALTTTYSHDPFKRAETLLYWRLASSSGVKRHERGRFFHWRRSFLNLQAKTLSAVNSDFFDPVSRRKGSLSAVNWPFLGLFNCRNLCFLILEPQTNLNRNFSFAPQTRLLLSTLENFQINFLTQPYHLTNGKTDWLFLGDNKFMSWLFSKCARMRRWYAWK